MSVFALCGGGTAGHITPLVAVADQIRRVEPRSQLVVIGTKGGRERELLPGWLGELYELPRLPFPRKWGAYALSFPFRWVGEVWRLRTELIRRKVDTVIGFGGYIAAPAYLAAWWARIPLVIHEANALPGMANRLGARLTRHVAVCFPNTPLPHARVVGMPLRREIVEATTGSKKSEAKKHFGVTKRQPVLLVTGGSTGAQAINQTIQARRTQLVGAGWQVIHLIGPSHPLPEDDPPGFVSVNYTDRMDLALAASDLVVSRAGAATVSELGVVGLPAVFVPYHVGNGEQRLNARQSVQAGGAIVVENSRFTPEWVDRELLPLMADRPRVDAMAKAMASLGVPDAAVRVAEMAFEARRLARGS